MKNKLRLGFTDTFDGVVDFFTDWLSPDYDIIRDDTNPQVLIFGDENFGMNNLKYDPQKVFKLFYTGENRRYWDYSCHAGITFDHIDSDKHFRIPLYVLNIHYMKKRFGLHFGEQPPLSFEELNGRKFCGYVQSNPNQKKRNDMFDLLSEKIEPIRSAGPHKNNVGYVLDRGENGILQKLEFLKEHKFTLAFENGSYAGYATEKLLEAYMARTIPLYWGSPTIEMDFNPDCFVNWHNYKNDDGFLNEIMHWHYDMPKDYIFSQGLFTENQKNKLRLMPYQFRYWFRENVYGYVK